MARLIDTTVQTDTANYDFKSREEAEAFFLSLKNVRATLGGEPGDRTTAVKPKVRKAAAMQTKEIRH